MHASVSPTVFDESKRSLLSLLLLGSVFMPLFGVLDWAIVPDKALVCIGIRLGFSAVCVGLFLLGRRLPTQHHLALAWVMVLCAAVTACSVSLVSRSVTLLVIFNICITPVLSSFLFLPRRQAFPLLGALLVVGCLIPGGVFFLQGVRETLLLSGLFAATAIFLLGSISSSRLFALRCAWVADMEAMERQRSALPRLASRAERRNAEVEATLAAITRLLGQLRESTTLIDSEAQQLSAAAQEMSVVIRETVSQSDAVADALVAIDGVGQQARASIEGFGEWEARTARPARARLQAEAREMANGIAAIGQLLEVVSSIARESRILALNAGVEAARSSVRKFQDLAAQMLHFSDGVRERSARIGDLVTGLSKASGLVETRIERFAQASDQAGGRLWTGLETTREVSEKIGLVRETVQLLTGAAEQQATSVVLLTQSAAGLQQSVEGIQRLVQDLERTSATLAAGVADRAARQPPARAA